MPAIDESSTTKSASSQKDGGGPERELVQRIVASSGFNKSALLTNFLNYICDRKLQGRESEINEYLIGVHALGRSPSYNPAEDNIVRSYARTLRQRLEVYFAEEGHAETLHIVIPRGSYVPQFEPYFPAPDSVQPTAFQAQPPAPPVITVAASGGRSRAVAIWIAAAALLAMAAIAGSYKLFHRPPKDNFALFWDEVLDMHRPNLLVLADSGVAILQDITGRPIHLHEYASGDIEHTFADLQDKFPKDGNGAKIYGAGRFKNLTSTADVRSLLYLMQLPQFAPAHVRVRYARDILMDDIFNSNAIIAGGPRANPWVELYEPSSDFKLEISNDLNAPDLDTRVVVNKKPHQGEQASYSNANGPEGPINHSILSFLPSVDGHGHALLFQGGNMGATQAAADFVTNADAMAPILAKAWRPEGGFVPFEVLLETRVVGASSPKATVITVHYH